MLYMLIIYARESEWAAASERERAAVMREHERLQADLRERGTYRGCVALLPTDDATTVRVRDGQTMVTDGPFAETREQFGGYYLVEARDLDEAMTIAARVPTGGQGSVEIRPVAMVDA